MKIKIRGILLYNPKNTKKFKVKTAWVNSNAFCVQVEEYILVKRFKIFYTWVLSDTVYYADWSTFMEHLWEDKILNKKHRYLGFMIDNKI